MTYAPLPRSGAYVLPPPFGRGFRREIQLDITQRSLKEVRAQMLDLAIVLTATTLALLIVTIRSFGRALETRRNEADRSS